MSGPMIGRQLGNYTLKRLIGEGGMGAVYEGEHNFLGDRVAIKVLHGTYANNTAISQRFFQEAKSAREIGHPSIIRVIDFGQSPDDGCLYLVMELLEGSSLADVIARGPIAEEQAARIIAAAADGLEVAHQKGVIHRDLKPDNIFLVGHEVKILDFGIAKVVSSSARTGTGALLGTPRYMAPEQARGSKSVGPQSDVYSLGVILYQMVTHQVPFDGEITEILIKILSDEPPRPSTLARISPEMEALILSCMSKDPAGRPSGMLDLRTRLTPWAGPPDSPARLATSATVALPQQTNQRSSTTLSASVGESVAQGGSQATGARDATGATPGGGRSSRGLLVGAGVATLAVAAVVTFMLRGGSAPAPAQSASPVQSASSAANGNTGPAGANPAPPPAAAPTVAAPTVAAPTLAAPATTATAAPAAGAPAAAEAPRRFTIRTDPPGAALFDEAEKALGTSPTVMSCTLPCVVHARLAGYKPSHEAISRAQLGDADEITLRLQRLPASRPASHEGGAPAKAAPAAGKPADDSKWQL